MSPCSYRDCCDQSVEVAASIQPSQLRNTHLEGTVGSSTRMMKCNRHSKTHTNTYPQAFRQEEEILGLEVTVADTACVHVPRHRPRRLKVCDQSETSASPSPVQYVQSQTNKIWAEQLLTSARLTYAGFNMSSTLSDTSGLVVVRFVVRGAVVVVLEVVVDPLHSIIGLILAPTRHDMTNRDSTRNSHGQLDCGRGATLQKASVEPRWRNPVDTPCHTPPPLRRKEVHCKGFPAQGTTTANATTTSGISAQ